MNELELEAAADDLIGNLRSSFLVLPRGTGFLDREAFETGYNTLVSETRSFEDVTPESVLAAIRKCPSALVAARGILGLSPPEFAHLAMENEPDRTVSVSQGDARAIDKLARGGNAVYDPDATLAGKRRMSERVRLLATYFCDAFHEPIAHEETEIHRFDKVDTREGFDSVRSVARGGSVPYSELLYERVLGRPYATHRDAVSGEVGDRLEIAIMDVLDRYGVPYHATARIEKVPGFDQAPDFLVPNAEAPLAVIEAKLAEDDGTTRDKVTRIQHLRSLSDARIASGTQYLVIACVDGRGLAQRREDVRKLIRATDGMAYTGLTLERMVEPGGPLHRFVTRSPEGD